VKQMANACALPVAVAGALMPDAHVGYGLPIGGVLATDNAVIPLRRRRGHRVPHEADRL
jgi:tRNA-splicing ligase RtcB